MYFCEAQNLLELGAVKFGIMSVPAIWCCPYQRSLNETGGCMEGLNTCAQLFHKELEGILQNLSSEYPAMNYSLANSYEMTHSIINGSQPSRKLGDIYIHVFEQVSGSLISVRWIIEFITNWNDLWFWIMQNLQHLRRSNKLVAEKGGSMLQHDASRTPIYVRSAKTTCSGTSTIPQNSLLGSQLLFYVQVHSKCWRQWISVNSICLTCN